MHAFLCPYATYRGSEKPEEHLFNAQLQEFSQRVMYLCLLQSNGKLSPEKVVEEIDLLWDQLERSKRSLNIGGHQMGKPEQSQQEHIE